MRLGQFALDASILRLSALQACIEIGKQALPLIGRLPRRLLQRRLKARDFRLQLPYTSVISTLLLSARRRRCNCNTAHFGRCHTRVNGRRVKSTRFRRRCRSGITAIARQSGNVGWH